MAGTRKGTTRAIRHRGRRRWKEDVGYHRRSLAENAMYRFKQLFGDHLASKPFCNPGDGGSCAGRRHEHHDLSRYAGFGSGRGYCALSPAG